MITVTFPEPFLWLITIAIVINAVSELLQIYIAYLKRKLDKKTNA
jgi:hypothetical protein